MQRTPASTPGGPKAHEENIFVTVRVRPLSRREQAMYDLIAWDCMDEHTIVFKNPNQERPAVPYTFGMFLNYGFQILAVFSLVQLSLVID